MKDNNKKTDLTLFENPTLISVLKFIWNSVKIFFHEKPGQIIGSAFILIMLWGFHGNLELLNFIIPTWSAPGVNINSRTAILNFIQWDREFISFSAGFFLLVIVPVFIIKFGFKQKLSDYGLGLPPKGKRKFGTAVFFTLTLLCALPFYIASNDAGMQSVYPFYKNLNNYTSFFIYELSYLPFFIAIEFIFRGYLLFGLAGVKDFETSETGVGIPGVFYFHRYAILIQMLSYTAWHLGKPVAELWGTPVWGLAAGVSAYAARSIWPVTFSHWVLNIFLDALILHHLNILFI